MLVFKKIDVWISASSIFVFAVLSLIMQDGTFMVGYITVGVWQVMSMLVHHFNTSFTNKGSLRYYYQYITLAAVLLMLSTPLLKITGFVFVILLFIAPIMAVYYTAICFRELRVLEAKKLIHLK